MLKESSKLEPGRSYLIRADGRGEEPHCFRMKIDIDGNAKISSGRTTYVYAMSGAREILDASIDKPVILLFDVDESQSDGSVNSAPSVEHGDFMDLRAGYPGRP